MTHKERMYWSKKFDNWCKNQRKEPCFENFIAYYEKMIEPTFIPCNKHNEIDKVIKGLVEMLFEKDKLVYNCNWSGANQEILCRWLTKLGYLKLEDNFYCPNFDLKAFSNDYLYDEEKADE